MFGFLLLAVLASATVAEPSRGNNQRIIGGSVTSIHEYPFVAALLYSSDLTTYTQKCVGSIVNIRSVVTSGSCFGSEVASPQWRIRVGSTWANDGGQIYNAQAVFMPSNINLNTYENDIAIVHMSPFLTYIEHTIERVAIAPSVYWMVDGVSLTTVGWGLTTVGGEQTEHIHAVTVNQINQQTCATRYTELNFTVADSMLCTGLLNVGGRDTCDGDEGAPLIHDNGQEILLVGVSSYAFECGHARYPRINTRMSSFTDWIVSTA